MNVFVPDIVQKMCYCGALCSNVAGAAADGSTSQRE